MVYHNVDLAALRTKLKARWEDVPFWTDAEANDAINEALHVWNTATGQWRKRIVITTTPNGPWIPLPSSVSLAAHVEFNGTPIDPTDLESMDMAHPFWEGDTTATSGVPSTITKWMPVGLYLIAVWPADAVGGNSLAIDGVMATPTLQHDSDYLQLSENEVNVLLGYALHVVTFSAGAGMLAQTSQGLRDFLRAAEQQNTRLIATDLLKLIETQDFMRYAMPIEVSSGNNGPTSLNVASN